MFHSLQQAKFIKPSTNLTHCGELNGSSSKFKFEPILENQSMFNLSNKDIKQTSTFPYGVNSFERTKDAQPRNNQDKDIPSFENSHDIKGLFKKRFGDFLKTAIKEVIIKPIDQEIKEIIIQQEKQLENELKDLEQDLVEIRRNKQESSKEKEMIELQHQVDLAKIQSTIGKENLLNKVEPLKKKIENYAKLSVLENCSNKLSKLLSNFENEKEEISNYITTNFKYTCQETEGDSTQKQKLDMVNEIKSGIMTDFEVKIEDVKKARLINIELTKEDILNHTSRFTERCKELNKKLIHSLSEEELEKARKRFKIYDETYPKKYYLDREYKRVAFEK